MITITKNMGLTHADFFRLLPRAIDGRDYVRDGVRVTIREGDASVTITLGSQQVRKIALLEIPHADVTLTFDGWDEEAREAFMARFDRAFQRGGG